MVGAALAFAACGGRGTPESNIDEAALDVTSPEAPESENTAVTANSSPTSEAAESDAARSDTSALVSAPPIPSAVDETLVNGVNSTGEASHPSSGDVADTLDGKQSQHAGGGVCNDEGCECDPGFGWYPDVEPTHCLQLCDVTDVLPLDSNAKVAALAAQGCEAIEGGLTASGAAVTSFAGLETIRHVGGDLVIEDTAVPTLAGLSGVERYTGTLVLINNTELTELGWYQLHEAGEGGLVVLSNPKLTTLSGLSGTSFPKLSVTIVGNGSLVNLDGLEMLSQAATIAVAQNPALVDTDAFGQLFSVETLTITENVNLLAATVGALNDVGTFTVADNPLLVSVFARCLVFAESVSIQNNPELSELIMPTLADAAFAISSNPQLPQCKVDAVSGGACSTCIGNDETATCE